LTLFESLVALLITAIVLLQVARRLSIPYPAMLAASGVVVAMIPGTPGIAFAPSTALALFIAPALVDAAYDFPLSAALRYMTPLIAFAVFGVIITTIVVALVGVSMLGLPIAAAIALGAIVSPPDAAAATAVLNSISVPRATDTVLRGESLFNDATALLLYSGAIAVLSNGGLDGRVMLHIGFAAPGGVVLGIVLGMIVWRLSRFVEDTLGGNLLQFAYSFLVWLVADHLGLSAVLCTAAFAMTIARMAVQGHSTRMRVHSFAVWRSLVFALNVFAFLLMGMQARTVIEAMSRDRLHAAAMFALAVVAAVILVRLVLVLGFNRFAAWRFTRRGAKPPATIRQGIFVGWCGMRGFVTLATAFALPESFPQRDVVVLAAFSVVLATLVVQGLTLAPLIRVLGLDRNDTAVVEVQSARTVLVTSALKSIGDEDNDEATSLREKLSFRLAALKDPSKVEALDRYRRLALASVAAQRTELEQLRATDRIGIAMYIMLQEELDWTELTLLADDDRRIEEA
jgi:monovalent cation/hydrogen antiporter